MFRRLQIFQTQWLDTMRMKITDRTYNFGCRRPVITYDQRIRASGRSSD